MRPFPPPPAERQPMAGFCGGAVKTRRESAQPSGGRGYSTPADNVPLKVVYWNVAGVRAADIDAILDQLDFVYVQWDVLVLLECSHARHELFLSGVRQSGHVT